MQNLPSCYRAHFPLYIRTYTFRLVSIAYFIYHFIKVIEFVLMALLLFVFLSTFSEPQLQPENTKGYCLYDRWLCLSTMFCFVKYLSQCYWTLPMREREREHLIRGTYHIIVARWKWLCVFRLSTVQRAIDEKLNSPWTVLLTDQYIVGTCVIEAF